MTHVLLADVPGHFGRRKRDIEPWGNRLAVNRIYIVHPHRHPRFVGGFVSVLEK